MSIHQLTIKEAAAAAALSALVLAGCSDANADRAGGVQQAEPVVLTFSNPINNDDFPPEPAAYADKVEELTGGEITFERTGNSREGSVDAERLLIEDVRDGTVDMAVVGVRALDNLGIDSLSPLIAPMVIDSYELQQAVFESDLPARMLGPLDELGVTGLAVIPGSLQRIVGREHAFLSIDDFAGAVFAYFDSQLSFDTYEALGATPKLWPAGAPLSEFDATVVQIAAIAGRQWEREATAVTVNANVWVRPWIVVINPDMFESLSTEQQQALREAAPAATADIIEATRQEDRETLEILCGSDLEFVTATDEQLDGIRAALEPVYASIAGDSQSGEHLAEIIALKEQLGVPADAPTCEPEDAARGSQPLQIDGVYTRTMTGRDILDANADSGCDYSELPSDLVLVEQITFDDGRIEWLETWSGSEPWEGNIGTYDVFRDRIEIRHRNGGFTVHWTFDGTNLEFTDMEGGACDEHAAFGLSRGVFTTFPWVRVND